MTSACLIIDDPRLCPRYGFLNFNELLEMMERLNFFSEIAYIPFNYQHKSKKIVKLFTDNPDRFGICLHGFESYQ